jgi:hypothetical protein
LIILINWSSGIVLIVLDSLGPFGREGLLLLERPLVEFAVEGEDGAEVDACVCFCVLGAEWRIGYPSVLRWL